MGPSQRQLRAAELIRHALVDILREQDVFDDALVGVSVTVTEVRLSPDLKHATVFIEPLGAGLKDDASQTGRITKALNDHAKFFRGQLGRMIDMKFTPDLRFRHDESFLTASHIDEILNRPEVRRDLDQNNDEGSENGA